VFCVCVCVYPPLPPTAPLPPFFWVHRPACVLFALLFSGMYHTTLLYTLADSFLSLPPPAPSFGLAATPRLFLLLSLLLLLLFFEVIPLTVLVVERLVQHSPQPSVPPAAVAT
jgi:hypothetical protein